jgi:hypothetical protein
VQTALKLGEIWRRLRRGSVFPANPLTGFIGFIGARDHLVPDGSLRRLIARHVHVDRLEEMRTPLHVIVTDLLTTISASPKVPRSMPSWRARRSPECSRRSSSTAGG